MRQAGHKPGQGGERLVTIDLTGKIFGRLKVIRQVDGTTERMITMEINKLKEARLSAGLTQKSMSEKTGIPMRTIGDWETGHRRPSDWVAALVIEKLNRIKQENAAAK